MSVETFIYLRGVAWEMAGHVHEWNHVQAVGTNDRIFLRIFDDGAEVEKLTD